jgi:Ser/Thr protein kinase RdoA (MazF antagonist)
MKIELQDISNILPLYNINSDVVDYTFFIDGFDEDSYEMKFIIKVELTDGRLLVVKFIRQEMSPHNVIEEQSHFSEYLRNRGILTPKRYKSGDSYCIAYPFNGFTLDITVEDYFGEEIKDINNELAYKIGQLMGKNHRLAENDNFHINNRTLFNVVGKNDVSGYDDFLEFGKGGLIAGDIFTQICAVYNTKLNRLKDVWGDLPRYATQGDYSTNNLVYIGDDIGIFDYNNAGDETLISDMVLEGLLTAYENGLTDADRLGLFKSFINGYIEQRPLSEKEKAVFSDIYAVAWGMWYSRILYSNNSLEELIKNKEYEKVSELMQKIFHDIDSEYPL